MDINVVLITVNLFQDKTISRFPPTWHYPNRLLILLLWCSKANWYRYLGSFWAILNSCPNCFSTLWIIGLHSEYSTGLVVTSKFSVVNTYRNLSCLDNLYNQKNSQSRCIPGWASRRVHPCPVTPGAFRSRRCGSSRAHGYSQRAVWAMLDESRAFYRSRKWHAALYADQSNYCWKSRSAVTFYEAP